MSVICKLSQADILTVLSMLQSLSHHSDEVLVASDNATVMLVKEQESELMWRVSRMQQLLMSCQLYMQSQWNDFLRVCSEAELVCEQVEAVVKETMLTDDVDEVMLTTLAAHLDQSLMQLIGDQSPLEAALRLSYILPLSDTESERLQRLSDHSHTLLCSMKERCVAVRQQLLVRGDNAQKCNDWLQFVAQIEHELNAPLASNFDALLKQRKALEASLLICIFH